MTNKNIKIFNHLYSDNLTVDEIADKIKMHKNSIYKIISTDEFKELESQLFQNLKMNVCKNQFEISKVVSTISKDVTKIDGMDKNQERKFLLKLRAINALSKFSVIRITDK